ncbi:MAG: GNAT family N-acetyltransferase [Thermodesulfovibrionales bacterium]|nr:GNAT family N-acetyltransferase [Thermodesulfovibrionales bacterium]
MSEYPRLIKLIPDKTIKPFNCDHEQLRGFLFENAMEHIHTLLAQTYIFEDIKSTIAYFSVSNDAIRVDDSHSKNWFRRNVLKLLSHEKSIKYDAYPAVKVGRFAVADEFRGKDVGTKLMSWIKRYFINKNKTGCRFITVDAYKEALGFYEKMGFKYLTKEDENHETRHMYFDLAHHIDLIIHE